MPAPRQHTPTWPAVLSRGAATWRQRSLRGSSPWRQSVWVRWRSSRRARRGSRGCREWAINLATQIKDIASRDSPRLDFRLQLYPFSYRFSYILDGCLFRSRLWLGPRSYFHYYIYPFCVTPFQTAILDRAMHHAARYILLCRRHVRP
jgi:hypothetical protein